MECAIFFLQQEWREAAFEFPYWRAKAFSAELWRKRKRWVSFGGKLQLCFLACAGEKGIGNAFSRSYSGLSACPIVPFVETGVPSASGELGIMGELGNNGGRLRELLCQAFLRYAFSWRKRWLDSPVAWGESFAVWPDGMQGDAASCYGLLREHVFHGACGVELGGTASGEDSDR